MFTNLLEISFSFFLLAAPVAAAAKSSVSLSFSLSPPYLSLFLSLFEKRAETLRGRAIAILQA